MSLSRADRACIIASGLVQVPMHAAKSPQEIAEFSVKVAMQIEQMVPPIPSQKGESIKEGTVIKMYPEDKDGYRSADPSNEETRDGPAPR